MIKSVLSFLKNVESSSGIDIDSKNKIIIRVRYYISNYNKIMYIQGLSCQIIQKKINLIPTTSDFDKTLNFLFFRINVKDY